MTFTVGTSIVALVGGEMTVDDGAILDSRQPIEEDDTSGIMRRTLASSSRWWTTVGTLAMPILEEAGANAFALVIGERSVVDIRPDGSLKRTSLRGLLPGGTDTVRIIRTGMDNDALPAGSVEATTLRAWNGQSMGKIGVSITTDSGGRWRFLDGNDFYMTFAGPVIAPKVIVDTTDMISSPLMSPVDKGWKAGQPLDYFMSMRFKNLEERRLFADTIVILPHTFRNEVVLRSYTQWIAAGKPPAANAPEVPTGNIPVWDPQAPPSPIGYTRLMPIDANFRITGLFERERWVSPEDLDAARSLLAARFDLKIGIWDLANNTVLRKTLLEHNPVTPRPTETANLPSRAKQRADAVVAQKVREREEESTAVHSLQEATSRLTFSGWVDLGRGTLRLNLTEPLRRWPDETDPQPLVSLILTVMKRQLTVAAMTSMYNDVDIKTYVCDRRDQLVAIAGADDTQLDAMRPILLRVQGGWADEVDWARRSADVGTKTSLWVPLFSELVAECRRILSARVSRGNDV